MEEKEIDLTRNSVSIRLSLVFEEEGISQCCLFSLESGKSIIVEGLDCSCDSKNDVFRKSSEVPGRLISEDGCQFG